MGDSYGLEQIEVFKSETVFGGILVADMLNSKGESILDIYSHTGSYLSGSRHNWIIVQNLELKLNRKHC